LYLLKTNATQAVSSSAAQIMTLMVFSSLRRLLAPAGENALGVNID